MLWTVPAALAACILLVLFVPLRLCLRLVDGQCLLVLRVLGIPVRILPRRQRAGKKQRRERSRKNRQPKPKLTLSQTVGEVLDILRAALPRLPRLFAALRVPRLRLEAVICRGDAAQTALDYGRICAAFGLLWQPLSRLLSLRAPRISLSADFEGEKSKVLCFADVQTCIGRLLVAAVPIAWAWLKLKMKKAGGKKNVKGTDQRDASHDAGEGA